MHSRDFVDLGRLMDHIFRATEEFSNQFGRFAYDARKMTEHRNFYSVYPFPPANIFMSQDKTLVFEFALAGYSDADVNLQFQGDYMVLAATSPVAAVDQEDVIFFNRRLKFKAIDGQKYFVPEDKFDREQARAAFKNGILKISIPAREEVQEPNGVKIDIVNEDE